MLAYCTLVSRPFHTMLYEFSALVSRSSVLPRCPRECSKRIGVSGDVGERESWVDGRRRCEGTKSKSKKNTNDAQRRVTASRIDLLESA